MKFFTSDLHFGSENTIKSDSRPFKNAKVFQKKILKNWNRTAKKDDIIYVIGDLIDCHSNTNNECVKKLQMQYIKC